MSADRLLLKPTEAAELLSVSRRTLYELMKTNADIRAAVVQIPGVRGTFIRRDLLQRAVERLSVTPIDNGRAA